MGSLASRPKVPSNLGAPQIVYIPQTASTTTSPQPDTGAANNSAAIATSASQLRSQNLLSRERSRFGTVLTGFRGFLTQGQNNSAPRKTLLGE